MSPDLWPLAPMMENGMCPVRQVPGAFTEPVPMMATCPLGTRYGLLRYGLLKVCRPYVFCRETLGIVQKRADSALPVLLKKARVGMLNLLR